MPAKQIKILMIDDEPEWVQPQIDALDDNGYDVVLCTSIDNAIDKLKKQGNEFDIIILDLLMPPSSVSRSEDRIDMAQSGVNLHATIREELGLVSTPIIFLSVVRDQGLIRKLRSLELRFGHQSLRYITKPTLPSYLIREVQRILKDNDR